MRVLVVDDERRARERLRRLLTAIPGVEVAGEASTGVAALEAISTVHPDAVFLDVQMPGLTGFEVLSSLPVTARPPVVFVTAYDQYALQAFDVSAVDYLLKPVTADRLARALARLQDQGAQRRLSHLLTHLQSSPLMRLVGKQRQALHVLPIDTIEAFVIEGELVVALTANGRFQIDRSLRELEAALDVTQFARVQKSVIVNLSTIQVIEPITRSGATARLRSGQTIHISRRYTPSLRQKLGW